MSRATDAIQEFSDNHSIRSSESASRWDWAVRSSEHLDIVVSRYHETAAELAKVVKVIEPGSEVTNEADVETEFDHMIWVSEILEVDVISFFVFASMMLDAVARGVAAFSGPARGIGMNSHHDLADNLVRYAELVGFAAPDPGLIERARDLYDRVNESRNKIFVHPETWRHNFGGFGLGEDGGATISLAYVGERGSPGWKKAHDRARMLHTPVPAFVEKLDEFVVELLAYLSAQKAEPESPKG